MYKGQIGDYGNTSKKKYLVVPYVPTLEKSRRHLKQFNTDLVFKYNNKLLKKLVNNKPNINISNGVYKIPCMSYNKVYIGETGRNLKKRLKEDKADIANKKTESGIAAHVRKKDHRFDFKKAKIIFPCNNYKRRDIVE